MSVCADVHKTALFTDFQVQIYCIHVYKKNFYGYSLSQLNLHFQIDLWFYHLYLLETLFICLCTMQGDNVITSQMSFNLV